MKKTLISLLLAFSVLFSLVLSSCEKVDVKKNANDGTPPGDNTASEGHVDKDNDGECDDCETSVLIEINFFVLNDFHGKMTDSSSQPGIEELSAFLKDAQSKNPNTVVFSSGDMWQGGAESNLTKGLIMTDWMNELDFAAMTLGNHEYDWGEEYIEANDALAEFPFLAINVFEKGTDTRPDYCAPSVIIEKSGLQIGIIGAIGDCYSSISADKVEDVYFKVGSELTSLVKAESEKLRKEGADIIVYSLHDGAESTKASGTITNSKLSKYYDTTLSEDGYVDIVFEGHTHQRYNLIDSYGVYHLQGGGDNKGITHAEVFINFANGKIKVDETEVIYNSEYKTFPTDPFIDSLFEKYSEEIEIANTVLGKNSEYRDGDTLRQLIAELYYENGVKKWGNKYNIVLGGGYISVRSPYNLEAGNVMYRDLMTLFPFDNQLVLCSIKGKDLKRKFFETENSDYFIAYGEYGESVKNSIDENATYYVVVDTYSSLYAPNRLTVVEEFAPDVYARDLLGDYIKSGGLDN